MVALYTTTDNQKIKYAGIRRVDRQSKTGWLFHVAGNGTSLQVWRSTDKGSTWATFGSAYTIPGGLTALELGSMFVDWQNRMYVPYRVNTAGQDRVYLYSAVITATGMSTHSQLLIASAANGGVAGSAFTGMAPGVVRHSDGRTTGFVAVAYQAGTQMGVRLYGFTIPAVGQPVLNTGIVAGTRQWQITEAAGGHQVPSVDFELSPAHMWVTWGRTYAHTVKLTWNGAGWNGPASAVRLSQFGTNVPAPPAMDWMPGVWRNPGWCVAQPYQNDTTAVVVWERNQANTKTTAYITPAHPAGVVKHCTLAVDWATRNIRVYAMGTSDNLLRYIDYVTASADWGTWNTVVATAISATSLDNYSVRRRNDGSLKYDVLYLTGAASPWTVNGLSQGSAYAPFTPTWVYSTYDVDPYHPPGNGAPMSATDELVLAWTFSDPDPADSQSAYALSKQIGSGTIMYWRATDHTWVPTTEIKNVLSPSGVTLDAGWASAGDPMTAFKVKVWDQSDTPSAYSEALLLKPSAVSLANITTPPDDVSVYTQAEMDISWTVVEQSAFRLDLYQTEAGDPNPLLWSSGWIVDSATRSYHIPYALPNGQYAIRLRTKNNDGLEWPAPNWPIGLRRLFTINVTQPPTPTITVTPSPSTGAINVAITNPNPAILNSNPGFEVNTTGWTQTGGTLTRSTAQANTGVASGRFVPDGVTLSVYPQMTPPGPAGTPGNVYTVWAWVRPDTTNKQVAAFLHWYNSGAYVSTTQAAYLPTAAATWTKVKVTGAMPAGTNQVVAAAGETHSPAPAAGDAFYVDDIWLMTGAQPEVTGNRVERRLAGDTTLDSLVVLETAAPVGSTYADWTATSGVAYEYRVGSVGDNQAISYSAWTA